MPSQASGVASVIRFSRFAAAKRSEEHTSELQSLAYLVCRLLLEKKKKYYIQHLNMYMNEEIVTTKRLVIIEELHNYSIIRLHRHLVLYVRIVCDCSEAHYSGIISMCR